MLASPPPPGPVQPPPPPGPARAQVSSKKLRLDELVPCRIVYVLNPTGEKSWRGHPGLVMAVAGRKAHVITLTTWKGKTCVQKWAGAEEPAKYRSWFVLVDNGVTENHDGLPVMMLQGDKKMPKLCYVDCKRTHWLDLSELEKFRSPGGDTEFFITSESNRALESHLAYLSTVETPWIDEVVVEEQWE
ncbi:uncharacterized protein LTHEOB_9336 [Neofusicoccum parvum]|nr:uncharacterized protein LTHEOB_9336 [Neofusicoccum parvum]